MLVGGAFFAGVDGEVGFDQPDEIENAGVVVVENPIAGVHGVAEGGEGFFGGVVFRGQRLVAGFDRGELVVGFVRVVIGAGAEQRDDVGESGELMRNARLKEVYLGLA